MYNVLHAGMYPTPAALHAIANLHERTTSRLLRWKSHTDEGAGCGYITCAEYLPRWKYFFAITASQRLRQSESCNPVKRTNLEAVGGDCTTQTHPSRRLSPGRKEDRRPCTRLRQRRTCRPLPSSTPLSFKALSSNIFKDIRRALPHQLSCRGVSKVHDTGDVKRRTSSPRARTSQRRGFQTLSWTSAPCWKSQHSLLSTAAGAKNLNARKTLQDRLPPIPPRPPLHTLFRIARSPFQSMEEGRCREQKKPSRLLGLVTSRRMTRSDLMAMFDQSCTTTKTALRVTMFEMRISWEMNTRRGRLQRCPDTMHTSFHAHLKST